MRYWIVWGLMLMTALNCSTQSDLTIREDIDSRLAQYAPVEITADLSILPASEQKVVFKLIEASKYMNEIFLRQVWEKNPRLRDLLQNRQDELGKKAYRYFLINFGPWDRLENNIPFIGTRPKPRGAGYYPEDMTREEFETYLKNHPEEAESLKSLYTIVRREGDRLVALPYSQVFRKWLEPAAELLREAASLTQNASLKTFLLKRADAFFTDDYFESDMAWMDLDSPVEITIGPYEVYEDALFGYKAAFESFVTLADPEESRKLEKFKQQLPAMEENLPIPDHMKNRNRGTESPIRVVDEIFTAGDTRAGVQTIAFNLPNDERVREQKGSKKVLLRNVIRAKYEKILRPIAERFVDSEQLKYLSAEAFTNEVLFHELAHGLGPGKIVKDGRQTEVRLELKDLYSASEEAKADVMGVYNLFFMQDKGLIPKEMRRNIAVTFLAGLFRSIRFGIEEAHGKGVALQLNYLMEKGAIEFDPEQDRFRVNFDRFEDGIRDLVHDLCVLQANGDYEGTKALFEQYAKVPDFLNKKFKALGDIPVDIVPSYPLAEQSANTE